MSSTKIVCLGESFILFVYITSEHKSRLIKIKRKFWVKITNKYGFLKPHAVHSLLPLTTHSKNAVLCCRQCNSSVATTLYFLSFHTGDSRDFSALAFNRAQKLLSLSSS
jgi:hypothetical protein